jgi:dethiobiotin synthetase
MGTGVFVTGTDTGVGKTVACVALLRALAAGGVRAVGMKPVAAGIDAGAEVNADVAALAEAGNVDAPLAERNPYAFAQPIAPHVAARLAGATIDLERIARAYAGLAARADVVIVEGAGGPLVPLGPRLDMLDVPKRLALPVLLVVGVRLGCLGHALAAELAVRARGLVLAGWIASRVDPAMARADDSIAALRARMPAPLVADLAHADAALPREALQRAGLTLDSC